MAVIDSTNRFQQKKKQNQVITHIARADLVGLAVLYHLYVKPDRTKAQSLLHAFATQALDRAAIELTNEQYLAFKDASAHTVRTIDNAYQQYLKEADETYK